jgi:chemotaxis protein methyltransferase CheR
MTVSADHVQALEIELLLEGIYRCWGYDYRDYARPSLRRRIQQIMEAEKVPTISALQDRILHDSACMERFVQTLSVSVTAMFRDPDFYQAFRHTAIPHLRTWPFIRIWIAGCSTGEEVYSTAIVLMEEKILDRCLIYATDISGAVLDKAKAGIYPLAAMQEYTANYQQGGGNGDFSSYYRADHQNAIFRQSLRDKIVFSQHNLATDASFNEFNMILCRNVMIYFDKPLQERVHALFRDSLCDFGLLALGKKESLNFSTYADCYEEMVRGMRLYKRKK